jgi:hypothetical protein
MCIGCFLDLYLPMDFNTKEFFYAGIEFIAGFKI